MKRFSILVVLLALMSGLSFAQFGALDTLNKLNKAKQVLDAAQKAKQVADAAQKAKQVMDAAQNAKRAVDAAQNVKRATEAVQNVRRAGEASQKVGEVGRRLNAPITRQNIVGDHGPIKPVKTLRDVMPRSSNFAAEHRTWVQRGGYAGFHIPNGRFQSFAGVDHPFRIDLVMGANHGCFSFGGFGFAIVDPVPSVWADNWNETDDVTVSEDDANGGYYLSDNTYPGVSVSLSALQFGCSHFAVGFSVGDNGAVVDESASDQPQDQAQDQPQDQPQQEVAPPPQIDLDPTSTSWSGQIDFQTGNGGLFNIKMTRTIGHSGPMSVTFLANGTFSRAGDGNGHAGTWAQTGNTFTLHLPPSGCRGEGATLTGALSPDGSTISGTWFETSASFLPCGKGSGTWSLQRTGAQPDQPLATQPTSAPRSH
jgi:hypothetical protein